MPAEWDKLKKIADKYGLFLIEDAAQGFGGMIEDKKGRSFLVMSQEHHSFRPSLLDAMVMEAHIH